MFRLRPNWPYVLCLIFVISCGSNEDMKPSDLSTTLKKGTGDLKAPLLSPKSIHNLAPPIHIENIEKGISKSIPISKKPIENSMSLPKIYNFINNVLQKTGFETLLRGSSSTSTKAPSKSKSPSPAPQVLDSSIEEVTVPIESDLDLEKTSIVSPITPVSDLSESKKPLSLYHLTKVDNGYTLSSDKSGFQENTTVNVPIILSHGISGPDTLYYQKNLSTIEDSSLINSYAVHVTHPDLRKYYPDGSVYYSVNTWPKRRFDWRLLIDPDGSFNGAMNMSYYVFYDRRMKYTHDLFVPATEDLKKIEGIRAKDHYYPFQNFRHKQFEWLDDSAWLTVVSNLHEIGTLLKNGTYSGLVFDTEEYGNMPGGEKPGASAFWTWEYFADPDYMPALYSAYPGRTYDEFATIVKKRGREFVTILNTYKPDLTILMLTAYSHVDFEHEYGLSQSTHGLLAKFIDGMIEASSDQTRFIDLCEGNFAMQEWSYLKDKTLSKALDVTSADKNLYTQKMRVGFPVFRNRAFPDFFGEQILTALDLSTSANNGQAYVWLYEEPQDYLEDPKGTWIVKEGNHFLPGLGTVFTRKPLHHLDYAYVQSLQDAVMKYSLGKTLAYKSSEKDLCLSQGGIKIPDVLTNVSYQIDIKGISSEDVEKMSFMVKSSNTYVPIDKNYMGSAHLSLYKEAMPDSGGQRLSFKVQSEDPVHILMFKCN